MQENVICPRCNSSITPENKNIKYCSYCGERYIIEKYEEYPMAAIYDTNIFIKKENKFEPISSEEKNNSSLYDKNGNKIYCLRKEYV